MSQIIHNPGEKKRVDYLGGVVGGGKKEKYEKGCAYSGSGGGRKKKPSLKIRKMWYLWGKGGKSVQTGSDQNK